MDRFADLASGALAPFFDDGLLQDVLFAVKPGKEATVYACRAHPSTGWGLVAAKVYTPRQVRGFRNDAVYQEGRVILDARVRRAVHAHTELGRSAQAALWVNHEYETLAQLYNAGADVPRPLARAGEALLIEYVGDEQGPAPQLQFASLEHDEAVTLRDRLLENVSLWLSCNVVHADLSAYNVLVDADRLVTIDFPQAVDPRFNHNAYDLLRRDLRNLARAFSRQGAPFDSEAFAGDLWDRWLAGVL